jgi:tight adherence protein B
MLDEFLSDPDRAVSFFASFAAFGLVLSLWLMGVVLWSKKRHQRKQQVHDRLEFAKAGAVGHPGSGRILRLWHEGREATTIVPGMIRRGLVNKLERIRMDAGWETSVSAACGGLAMMLALVGALTYLIASSVLVAGMGVAAACVVFWIFLTQRITRRTDTFERQLIDALELAARSLRIGHPLVGSFRLISEEIPEPVGRLFADVCQQQALGMPMEEALREVADASTSEDLKLFATSVVIQLSSGGNLADMMERLANVIRERQRLARRVKVLTAQTQFSKRVLLALPFLVFVLLNVINPTYMRPLYTTAGGQLIMLIASIGLLLGWLTMNWLSKLTF